jgi:hypothetical protein
MGQVWATGVGSKRQPLRSPLDNGMPRQVLSRAQGMQQATASQQSDVSLVTKELRTTTLRTWVVQRLSSQTPKTRRDQRSHWMMFWQRQNCCSSLHLCDHLLALLVLGSVQRLWTFHRTLKGVSLQVWSSSSPPCFS